MKIAITVVNPYFSDGIDLPELKLEFGRF
jgi:hypothetical protein